MGKGFNRGDKVVTANGWEGKVIAVDTARNKVAVKATNEGVGHDVGSEQVFFTQEVHKA